MPAYSPATSEILIVPSGRFVHLDGTESGIESGYKSAAFERGPSHSGADNGTTWYVSGCQNGTRIQVQGSNQNIDGTFLAIETITPDVNGNGACTDVGRARYYRCAVSSLVAGDVPVCIAQR